MKKFLLLLMLLSMAGATATQAQDGSKLPPVPDNEGWVVVDKFDGGLNEWFPADKLRPQDAQVLTNFLPYGQYWLKKREGYQKIDTVTAKGVVWGLGMGDSANVASRLVVAGTDTLYYTDDLYNGAYYKFGTTTSEATFFVSTPFGVVISNDGGDSIRLWDCMSVSSILPLGIADTATISTIFSHDHAVLADTFTIFDSNAVWTADEWIGYYVFFTSPDSLWEIMDNWVCSLHVVNPSDADTQRAQDGFEIISQPDSTTSDLTYPRGRAVAYCFDRLFVSSKWYPWRIYYSQERLINSIDPNAFINLDMDAHDEIQTMKVFNGNLIAFGSNSIYGINSSRAATPITKALGCSAPKSVAVGDDYIYFLSQPTGVYRFNGNIFGSMSYKLERISDPIRSTLASVSASVLDNAAGVYMDKQYWLAYSPDTCLVFDERTNGWYKQGFGFTDALALASDFRTQSSETIYPTSDETSGWTSTGGNDYGEIDDKTDDTDYISTSGDATVNEHKMGDLSNYPTDANIQSITVGIRAQKRVGAANVFIYVDLVLPQSGTDSTYRVGTVELSNGFQDFLYVVDENPFYDFPWISTTIDSLQLRFTSENNASIDIDLSGAWIEPSYRSDVPTTDFLFAGTHLDYIYKYGGILTDDTSGTEAGYVVSGEVATATYRSGWFHTGSPIHQYQLRELYLDKQADGDVTAYIYSDRSSTADDTITFSSTSDAAELEWPTPQTAGHNFSIKLETTADSCFLKGWGALIRDLGKRK